MYQYIDEIRDISQLYDEYQKSVQLNTKNRSNTDTQDLSALVYSSLKAGQWRGRVYVSRGTSFVKVEVGGKDMDPPKGAITYTIHLKKIIWSLIPWLFITFFSTACLVQISEKLVENAFYNAETYPLVLVPCAIQTTKCPLANFFMYLCSPNKGKATFH